MNLALPVNVADFFNSLSACAKMRAGVVRNPHARRQRKSTVGNRIPRSTCVSMVRDTPEAAESWFWLKPAASRRHRTVAARAAL
jgi:hypothetical protein